MRINLRYKAIIFDMDGVITNTMPYHFDAWLDIFSSVGIKVNCYDVYKREGEDGLTTIKEMFRQHRKKFNLQEAKKLLSRKEDLFKRTVKKRFVKGARPFVRYLKKRGFLLALVTGTSRHEAEEILPCGLFNMFNVTVTGNEIKKGKPHPEPFLKALKLLKVSSKEAAVIENAPFGVEAAKRANLFCIALETSLPKKYLSRADFIFKSFAQLKEKIYFAK